MTFEDFLAAHFDRLAGYARLLTGHRTDAEDLLADTLLAAHQRWDRIAAMEISSRYLSALRRWSRRHIEVRADLPDTDTTDPIGTAQTRTVLLHHLRALPPRQRTAGVLHYFYDLPYDQVGRELGLSAGGARTLVFRALTALRVDPTLTPEDLT